MPAASLERKGFQTRYSVFVETGMEVVSVPLGRVGEDDSTAMRFSP